MVFQSHKKDKDVLKRRIVCRGIEAYPTRRDDSRHNLESNSKCSPEEMAGTQHGYSSNSAPIKPINAPVELITQRTSSYSYNTTSLSVPFQTSTSLKTPQHPSSSQVGKSQAVLASRNQVSTRVRSGRVTLPNEEKEGRGTGVGKANFGHLGQEPQ
mgnify:CR=1 FL=1